MIKMTKPVDGVYGGNRVSAVKLEEASVKIFASGVYEYYICTLSSGSLFPIENLGSFTVFLLHSSEDASVTASRKGFHVQMHASDIVQVENGGLVVGVASGTASILVAGTRLALQDRPSVKHSSRADIKKLIKPWGHELWFSGENASYAFKEIAIKKGTKTSLQYHHLKKETNVLFEGHVLLHYKNNDSIDNDSVVSTDISTVELHAISSIDVEPPTLHRLESLSDVLLYEVSTPHLDDVIRVSDDTSRVHGRIDAEHEIVK